jgi:hypothetical protein
MARAVAGNEMRWAVPEERFVLLNQTERKGGKFFLLGRPCVLRTEPARARPTFAPPAAVVVVLRCLRLCCPGELVVQRRAAGKNDASLHSLGVPGPAEGWLHCDVDRTVW